MKPQGSGKKRKSLQAAVQQQPEVPVLQEDASVLHVAPAEPTGWEELDQPQDVAQHAG